MAVAQRLMLSHSGSVVVKIKQHHLQNTIEFAQAQGEEGYGKKKSSYCSCELEGQCGYEYKEKPNTEKKSKKKEDKNQHPLKYLDLQVQSVELL